MRLATWNVNSLKSAAAAPRSGSRTHSRTCCASRRPSSRPRFPIDALRAALGYETAHHGLGQWNGVAILSRVGLEESTAGFGVEGDGAPAESRLLSAVCGGVRVTSVYVPNGRF